MSALILLTAAANSEKWSQLFALGAVGSAMIAIAILAEDNEWWLEPGSFQLRRASLVRERWFCLMPGSPAAFEVSEGSPDGNRVYTVSLRPEGFPGALYLHTFQSESEAHLFAGTVRATVDSEPPGDAMPPG